MSTAERLEELRILPRVSAEDRRRYGNMQSAAEIQLELYEPLHSRRERRLALRHGRSVVWLEPHNPESLHMHPLLWRKHWRSLPDYDGPPMRAPSGPVWEWERYFDGSVELDVPLSATTEQEGRTQHDTLQNKLMGMGAEYVPQTPPRSASPRGRLFDAPSKGGRGWCPKLAGVAT